MTQKIIDRFSSKKFLLMLFVVIVVFYGILFTDKITEVPGLGFIGSVLAYYFKKDVDEKEVGFNSVSIFDK